MSNKLFAQSQDTINYHHTPPNSRLISYADDTVILVHGSDWNEAQHSAEFALQTSQPAADFSLTAHNCNADTNYDCGYATIRRTDSVTYLGVLIDSAMTWAGQINILV